MRHCLVALPASTAQERKAIYEEPIPDGTRRLLLHAHKLPRHWEQKEHQGSVSQAGSLTRQHLSHEGLQEPVALTTRWTGPVLEKEPMAKG